jgi:hypothetical protein
MAALCVHRTGNGVQVSNCIAEGVLNTADIVNCVRRNNTANVQRNTEARSCNHCCRGKAISITYY